MRNIRLNQNNDIVECPNCKNNTRFTAHSSQVSADSCEVWVECVCGFDPTANKTENRFEDVYGGVDNRNVRIALDCWNDAINEDDCY